MSDNARYRLAVRRACREMPNHFGRFTSFRVVAKTQQALRDGRLTLEDATFLLDALASGDLSRLAKHPAFRAKHKELFWVEPDGTRTAFPDPRFLNPQRRVEAVNALAHEAREGRETLSHFSAMYQLVVQAAESKAREDQSLAARIRMSCNDLARGPDRLEPPVVFDVAALVSAARPGPFTGVVPVSV